MKLAKKKSTSATKKKTPEKSKSDSKKKKKEKDKKTTSKKGDKKKKDKAKAKEKKSEKSDKKQKKSAISAPKTGSDTKKVTAKKTVAKPSPMKTKVKKTAPSSVKKTTSTKKPNAVTKSTAKKASSAKGKPASKKVVKKATKTVATKPKTVVTKDQSAEKKKPTAAKKTTSTRKSTAVTESSAKKKSPTKNRPVAKKTVTAKKRAKALPDIPAILLEGDEPRYSRQSGPGARFETGASSEVDILAETDLVLPEAYGTKQIHLVARDPQWVYAHWDLTDQQLHAYNQLSRSGSLTLQVFENEIIGRPKVQIELHPESRSWFAHVGKGGGDYYAVLGFHDKLGDWQEVAVSAKACTPPDSLSDDLEATFTSIPVSIPFGELIKVVREYAANEPQLAKALSLIQQSEIPDSAAFSVTVKQSTSSPQWSKAQQQALADAVSMEEVRRVWIGSEEVLELIKGREVLSSEAAIPPAGISSITSPYGGEQAKGERGFWFNVNAELIIYGATEPDATVTIGQRAIKLREDGSFSYRFVLPDGQYQLPIAATSADKVETRNADLEFARSTEYRGEVGQHPQDPKLKKPSSTNVS